MGINIYNDNEEKFSETLKALKELPKINAPDNFEFNLMLKIENGEIKQEVVEKRESKLLWILAPAALVVSTVILFVTFSKPQLDEQLAPLQNQGSIYAGKVKEGVAREEAGQVAKNETKTSKPAPNRTQAPVQSQPFYIDPSLPLVKDYSVSPLNKEGAFNLDNLIQGRSAAKPSNAFTVQTGGIPDELLLKSGAGKPSLKERKAVKDSLKKMVSQNDSLKLRKNIKR